MIDSKQIKSLSVLGYNFWIHVFKSVIPKKKVDQAGLFKGYFQKDWITALKKQELDTNYNPQQCTVCGLCQDACAPSWVSQGKFLGPEHLAACAGRSQPEYVSDIDDFFRCTLCGRREPACPEEVKVSDLSWFMRRWIYRVDPAATWALFPQVKKNLDQFKNPFGQEKVPVQTGSGKNILFPGCREMALGEPEKWAKLLQKAGIEARLVSGVCCGGLLEEIGAENFNIGLESLVAQNPETVITTCPHCFYNLKKKLPTGIQVKFILEMVPENMALAEKPGKAVYHDPCFLSRKSGMSGLPRLLLNRNGVSLLEFAENGDRGDCCGGGGGLPWFDMAQANRVALRLVEEAVKMGAETILTECGICKDLLTQAGQGKVKVRRVSELYI